MNERQAQDYACRPSLFGFLLPEELFPAADVEDRISADDEYADCSVMQ